jgi:hypothetical protein
MSPALLVEGAGERSAEQRGREPDARVGRAACRGVAAHQHDRAQRAVQTADRPDETGRVDALDPAVGLLEEHDAAGAVGADGPAGDKVQRRTRGRRSYE